MEKQKQDFADRLRGLLDSKEMTPYRLAQLSGITKQSISRMLLRQMQPSWDTVQA